MIVHSAGVVVLAVATMRSAFDVVFLAVAFALGLSVHEFAHAWVALRLGDLTPKLHGRLSLNPKVHVDPFGTIILPAILLLVVLLSGNPFVFGYAKPQELNPWSLRTKNHHVTYIALAGPAANLVLAFAFGLVLRVAGGPGRLGQFLTDAVVANALLAAFNLIPIPPLDMTRVVTRYLPPRPQEILANMEQYGALFMLVIFFIIFGPIHSFVDVIANGICQATTGGPCL